MALALAVLFWLLGEEGVVGHGLHGLVRQRRQRCERLEPLDDRVGVIGVYHDECLYGGGPYPPGLRIRVPVTFGWECSIVVPHDCRSPSPAMVGHARRHMGGGRGREGSWDRSKRPPKAIIYPSNSSLIDPKRWATIGGSESPGSL